jgi:hypothetical protein
MATTLLDKKRIQIRETRLVTTPIGSTMRNTEQARKKKSLRNN